MPLIQWSKQPQNAADDTPGDLPLNEQFEEDYIRQVFDGEITIDKLDERYHRLVSEYLYSGAQRGFKGNVGDFTAGTAEELTISGLRRNIFQFSAAKQYHQVLTMSEFIYTDGIKNNFSEFRKLAQATFDVYNKNYLQAEFVTAVGQAQSARDWVYFEENKDLFPYLRYHTQLDGRVRDEHKVLEGITRRTDDAFWRHYAPKNGWRCRCFLTAHETGRSTDLSKREIPEFGTQHFPKVFDMNPGIDKLIFDPKTHPYFFVEKGDKELKDNNFNLPLP